MDKQERDELIEQYGQGYDNLLKCLDEIPKEMWQFKPEPSEWSVHEIIVHLADSETNSALRARRLIAEPGSPVAGYDQAVWATELDYHNQSWEDALEGLHWARKTTYALIKDLPNEVWSHAGAHSEIDKSYTLELWLKIYAGHIPTHIDQIQENYRIWQSQQ